ncbi:MAG: cytochrome C, partial [Deltaproteobacteria bacterium]|nr:cytochrome C [Deltaproteobacteria bacterium]
MRTNFILLHRYRSYVLVGLLLFLCGILYLTACAPSLRKPRKFVRKNCLECHTKFADKYLKMKSVHAVVKEKKCEECHLRHGIVPKLIFKQIGNQTCYQCHPKEKISLDKPRVHTAIKKGKCIDCHNPHASQSSRLLQAEGSEVCYQCHKKKNFEKKVEHKALQKEPCLTCHSSHGSD